MKPAELSIKNPVATYLIILTIFILGIISIPRIPVSFWPEFVAPTLIVIAPYPGVGPQEMEEQIAVPLEEELSTIDRVDEIETTCMEGVCRILVRFEWGVDFDQAKLDVQERANKARSNFPFEALEPRVLQVQDFLPPGIELGFISTRRNLNQIRDFVDEKLKNRFLRLKDVATIHLSGGPERHILIAVDPDKMAAFAVTFSQINSAISSENMNVPGGRLHSQNKNYYLKTIGKFSDLTEIENVIVASKNGAPIYLKNIARVSLENKENETYSRLNGRELIIMSIREKSGGNTVSMCDEVKEELQQIRSILPADLEVVIIRDESIFIKNSIQNVLRNAGIGAILASIIILLFLGNIRNTLIIVFSIPVSIIGTFILINLFGLSINTISLGGLALGVGLIVDSTIVVIENIYRRLKEEPELHRFATVTKATSEVGMAITASNLTSVVVFLPMAFLVGLFAVLLGELALTVVFALTISILVAITIVPLLSYNWMQTETGNSPVSRLANSWQNMFNRILDLYRPILKTALNHRFLTLLLSAILLVVAIMVLAPLLDVELLPAVNEGEFRIELTLPEGTRLEVTDELVHRIEQDLNAKPEIYQYYTLSGVQSARGELKPNFATITVQLKPEYLEQISEIMAGIRARWNDLPATRLQVRQTDVTEGMRSEPVNVRVVGDDLNMLNEIAANVLSKLRKIPGIINLNSSIQQGLPQVGLQIDREKASDLGMNSAQIAATVRTAVLGLSNTRFSGYGEEYDITLKMDDQKVRTISDLMDLPLMTRDGTIIPLRNLVIASIEEGPSEIKRIDQQRMVEIKSDISGRSRRGVTGEIRRSLENFRLPPDYFITYGGQSRAIGDSFRSLMTALLIAILLVYVVMGAQFNSFVHPFTIAFTIPLAMLGVFLGLYVFGASISMNALLGIIMLVGIVVNNGILLIDYILQLRSRGMEKNEAILKAGITRLRPILITSLTTIFGMLPIALGLGEGGEAIQPLGAVVVGGLATSSLFTLIVIPCIYSLLDRFSRRKSIPV